MTRFHSKVVRVKEMGGKVLVEFKEKRVDSSKPDEADIDSNEVKVYDGVEVAEAAVDAFMGVK